MQACSAAQPGFLALEVLCTVLHVQDEYKDEAGTVIAADFYHANQLLPLSDEEIIAKVHNNLVLCEPAFAAAKVMLAQLLIGQGAACYAQAFHLVHIAFWCVLAAQQACGQPFLRARCSISPP